jgi:hypothetical protein
MIIRVLLIIHRLGQGGRLVIQLQAGAQAVLPADVIGVMGLANKKSKTTMELGLMEV